MYIRIQKVKRDDSGQIVSGSAAICKTVYDPNQNSGHSRREVVEKLGKVIWLNENNTEGIFFSPTRGLVSYNAAKDSFSEVESKDSRLQGTDYENQEVIHTTFGDVYLFLTVLGEGCLLNVLRSMSDAGIEYQRLLAHLTHEVLRNGKRIKCGEFLDTSMLTYMLQDISRSTLDCDSAFFADMGHDRAKLTFFKQFVTEMRKIRPNFGRACYVDSTPVPNDIDNNPYNALCSHGTDGTMIQTRFALVLDIETNLPVWFHIFPSNILDHSTIMAIANDIKASIDVDIIDNILDAGYACKELFERYHIPSEEELSKGTAKEGFALVRMPAKPGYPYSELYLECKNILFDVDYLFDYKGHSYFGKKFVRTCLGYSEYCYVFLDQNQANDLGRNWRQTHPDEWEALSRYDKEWYMVKDGFFILVGNKDDTPRNILVEYRDRVRIELIFKTMKDFENLLPVKKWDATRVKGKILMDIIGLVADQFFREALSTIGLEVPTLLVQLQSLECFNNGAGLLEIYTPKANVRSMYETIGYQIPGHLDMNAFKDEIIHGIPMERSPVTVVKKRPGRKPKVKNSSPEERVRAKELKDALSLAQRIYDKALRDADTVYTRKTKSAKTKYDKALERALKKEAGSNSSINTEVGKTTTNNTHNIEAEVALANYNSQVAEAGLERDAKIRKAKADYVASVESANNQFGYQSA